MPPIAIDPAHLATYGPLWIAKSSFNKKEGMDFGKEFDRAVGESLAAFLGNQSIVMTHDSLIPGQADIVEIGPVRIVGGVRTQNFDVGYRPDGIRFAFDSKTLNSQKSVGKNWQNMINDIATESTTVHTRFPYAVTAFMLICTQQGIHANQMRDITQTLERLSTRRNVTDHSHLAEAISFVIWDAAACSISPTNPSPTSPLRIEKFSSTIQTVYSERYKGLPPHT